MAIDVVHDTQEVFRTIPPLHVETWNDKKY